MTAELRTRGQIVSVLGHEHELGNSFRLTLNPDTPEERVLLDIPRWEFGWQFNYYPVEDIIVQPGTLDEMRFGTMTVRELG